MEPVRIPLHSRKYPDLVAIVDSDDVPLVNQYKWHPKHMGRTIYARANAHRGAVPTGVMMHRLILGLQDPKVCVDHINHDGLDNRRSNLRIVSHQMNMRNMRPHASRDGLYKGVYQLPHGRWRAMFRGIDHRIIHVGVFDSADDAARAYDEKARELFGEFAYLNFPEAAS